MLWYNNELVPMAKEIGYRLLPAFNTSTGIPYPRVSSLRYCKFNHTSLVIIISDTHSWPYYLINNQQYAIAMHRVQEQIIIYKFIDTGNMNFNVRVLEIVA